MKLLLRGCLARMTSMSGGIGSNLDFWGAAGKNTRDIWDAPTQNTLDFWDE